MRSFIGSSSRWTTSCWHTAKLQMSCNRSWRRYNLSANPCSAHSLTLPVLSNMMSDQLRHCNLPYSHNKMSQVLTEVITNALYKCDLDPRPICHSTSAFLVLYTALALCARLHLIHLSSYPSPSSFPPHMAVLTRWTAPFAGKNPLHTLSASHADTAGAVSTIQQLSCSD